MRRVILASGSKQRKILMDALRIDFEVIPSDVDEKSITAKNDKERARLIALVKAKKVLADNPEAIVISADTFTFVNQKAYEKPKSLKEAELMLREQSGQEGICYSGCAYFDPQTDTEFSTTVETNFSFRKLSTAEIKKYVNANQVLTWSAAFCPAYPEGMNMVNLVNGSFTGFSHGLPMEVIIPLLEKSGVFEEE